MISPSVVLDLLLISFVLCLVCEINLNGFPALLGHMNI